MFVNRGIFISFVGSQQARFTSVPALSGSMESMQLRDDAVKCVIVGDSSVGKTRLICARASGTTYTLRQLMHTHVPTVWAIDHYRNNKEVQERSWCTVDGVTVPLCLWDTFGYHDKDRQFAYGRADVVLICFSLVRPRTLHNVVSTWFSEVQHFCPGVPVILCGCQADLRYLYHDKDFLAMDKGPFFREICDEDIITPQQGRTVAKQIGAPYYESSVLTRYGVEEVFMNVARLGIIRQRGLHFWNALSLHLKKVTRLPSIQKPYLPPKPKMPSLSVALPQLKQDMLKLLDDSTNSDIVFVAEGDVTFHAHKACLVAATDIFDFLQTEKLYAAHTKLGMDMQFENPYLKDEPRNCKNGSEKTAELHNTVSMVTFPPVFVKQGEECKHEHVDCQVLEHSAFYCIQDRVDGMPPGGSSRTVITLHSDISADAFRYILEFLYTASCAEWPSSMSELIQIQDAAALLGLSKMVSMVTNVIGNEEYQNHDIEASLRDSRCERIKTLLIKSAVFSDVKFQLDDGCVAAHKCLVMARSDVLKSMFSYDFREHDASIVPLPGRTEQSFLALLEYLYTDRWPDLTTTDVLDVLEIANCYCLPRLVALGEEYVVSELQQAEGAGGQIMEEVLMLLEHAQLYNAKQLAQWCLSFLSVNYIQLYEQHSKLLHRLQPHNQVYLSKHRWPPLWYVKEMEYYEKKMIDLERENKTHRNFRALKRNCLCFCID